METRAMKQRILDAAQALIQQVGVNAMSYQHISDAVGIRKASIHHHFPTKDQLIDALIQRYSAYFLGLVDAIIASEADAPSKVQRYMALFEATLREGALAKACPCGMLGAELATLGSAAVVQLRAFYRANEQRLAQIIEQGRKEGTLTCRGTSEAVAACIFALLEGGMLLVRAEGGVDKFQVMTAQCLLLLRA